MIFIHELGHYLVAKWAGVKVHVFAVGFGPAIFKRRIGETDYQLCVLPFGGYVAMQEEPEPDTDPGRSLAEATPAWKTAILLAGVVFNLVSSFILLLALTWSGMMVTPAQVGDVQTEIVSDGGRIVESPASQLGLPCRDTILELNGRRVRGFDQLRNLVVSTAGTPLTLKVNRGGEEVILGGDEAAPITSVYSSGQGIPSLGVVPAMGRKLELPWQGTDAAGNAVTVPKRSELIALDQVSVANETGQAVRQKLLVAWPQAHEFTFATPSGDTVVASGEWQGIASLDIDGALGLPIQVTHVQAGQPAAGRHSSW